MDPIEQARLRLEALIVPAIGGAITLESRDDQHAQSLHWRGPRKNAYGQGQHFEWLITDELRKDPEAWAVKMARVFVGYVDEKGIKKLGFFHRWGGDVYCT